jgi:hypothetical protein
MYGFSGSPPCLLKDLQCRKFIRCCLLSKRRTASGVDTYSSLGFPPSFSVARPGEPLPLSRGGARGGGREADRVHQTASAPGELHATIDWPPARFDGSLCWFDSSPSFEGTSRALSGAMTGAAHATDEIARLCSLSPKEDVRVRLYAFSDAFFESFCLFPSGGRRE